MLLPGFARTTGGSPAEAVVFLSNEIRKALADPKVNETVAAQGVDPGASTPAEFRKFFAAEFAKWAKLVKQAGIKAD